MAAWFEENPDFLQHEEEWLNYYGYEYEIDQGRLQAGQLVMHVKYPDGDITHDLTVTFPKRYPDFPFTILAPSFPEGSHKEPYTGQLCLLKDPLQNWDPYEDTLGSFLKTQVQYVLDTHRNPGKFKALEAPEARQVTGQIPTEPGCVIRTGEWQIPEEHSFGFLLLGVEPSGLSREPNRLVRGAVLEVQDQNKNCLVSADSEVSRRYTDKAVGRWVRLPAPPKSVEGFRVLDEAREIWPKIDRPSHPLGKPDVVGLLFPEQFSMDEAGEDWVFVVRPQERSPQPRLVRRDTVGRDILQTRVPRLRPLAEKRVVVVGLGSVGSIIAWQLARAGVGQLILVDCDTVEMGNSPRWLRGWSAVGMPKPHVLQQILQQEHPYLKVEPEWWRIGDPRVDESSLEAKVFVDADLVIDATAEDAVTRYLQEQAQAQGATFVWAAGRPGAYGGLIGRTRPGKTEGCWNCLQGHLRDGTINKPAQEDSPQVQTVGCFHPTFTGSGFDMDFFSLTAVRVAVASLCSEAEGGYPDFNWDVAVINLWDAITNTPIAPTCETHPLTRHPECEYHD